MSNPGDADATPITSLRELADFLAQGCRPPSGFTIGTEHEKFGFRPDFSAPPYEPQGIRALLEGMAAADDWEPIVDAGHPIGLKQGSSSVSLEPAGQLELSGAPLATLHETHAEIEAHNALVRRVAGPLGLGFAPLGFHPTLTRAQMPWMPKGRYAIMRRYMPQVGGLGLDMMTRTCTVQVNLDFASEADMVRKLRVSLALQPLATALFANSPFTEGRPNGFLSYRGQIWTDTDPHRTGIQPVFFEDGFGFERYVEWVVDSVPMYFVHRDGRYIDLAGRSFRDFMEGRLADTGAGPATIGDFADHLTTVFTDVRLKRFLEMRGADAGSVGMMVAQSALWVGLLYDDAALAAAEALVHQHHWTEFAALRPLVVKSALQTPWQRGTLRDLAREVVAIARDGLRARARYDAAGQDESVYLQPLEAIVSGGPTQAEAWLDRFHGAWQGDVTRIFQEAAI
ncbi:Glutamate--cysteine ligase [Rhodovastum atsumiense]|uniref:Glutamate--cysteine ligase n=1 Tax=Rhodovastum atsumiense TaxID=504468 RepID=A0A5M6IRS9_9PROT|nr:glutamate--cysteine ligase [Rhodovastum atsumiense]KAA5610982.1 glutamate--cysteine ligase [Rhodovastum atsumiense]CAH2600240.1 Glutamate--cysteine ligase [Rhodovastum atsumiense]